MKMNKFIFFIIEFIFLLSKSFSHNFTASITDKHLNIEKDLYICYGSPNISYNCYRAQEFPYLVSYSNDKIVFLDIYNNFKVELNYHSPQQISEFKYYVLRDGTIRINTAGLYFYALIYVPKDNVYLFYYNKELVSPYETNSYYIVPLISDGILKIKKLTSSLSGNIFEARLNNFDYSKVCFTNEKFCCDLKNLGACKGIYIPNFKSLKINKDNNSFFFYGVRKLGQVINITYLNLTNSLVDKYLYEIKSNQNLTEFDFLWKNFLGDLVRVYINNKKSNCNQVVLNGQKYCSIQVLGPTNNIIITLEKPKELPVAIVKKTNILFTNSSDKLDAVYYEKEKKMKIVDKIEGLTLVLENVSFNISKEIPEVELYIVEKTKNKTVVKASVIKGLNYSKAYIELNVHGRVKQIIKNNGTSSIIWKLFSFLGGKLIIEFNEKDPIFYIENEPNLNKKLNSNLKNKEDKLDITKYLSFINYFQLPQLNTFTIYTDPYSTQPTKVSLFNLFYLTLSLIGFFVYYIASELRKMLKTN